MGRNNNKRNIILGKDTTKTREWPDCFQIKHAGEENDTMDLINPKWMAENTSVLFYELAQSLPLLWIHVPVGNTNKEEAPKRLLSDIKTQYQQGSSNLCLLKSLASTLKYMKLEYYAGLMNQIAPRYQFLPFPIAYKKIQEDMRVKAPRVGNCMVFNKKGRIGRRRKT